ncbi:MAG TPA: choice-of-anchor D domain-containing protein, partial [Solirubrobacterales bacterium]|nr:choice-of-anchor D domain-containing protein [Solirubrobacterales bacterium]
HATFQTLASSEIYDPASGEFAPGPAMAVPRTDAAAAPLPDGRVLVMGGRNSFRGFMEGSNEWLPSTEIYDPTSETFEPGPATPFNLPHGVAALASGRILVVGDDTFQEYDPAAEAFIDSGIDSTPYRSSAAAALPGGRALLAGHSSSSWGPEEKQAWIFVSAPLAGGESVDFGEVPVGEVSGPETLATTNEGAQALAVESASLTGPDAAEFEIVADECSGETLAFGEECAIEVVVTPAGSGPLTAAVALTDNAPSSPHSFALAAAATEPGGGEEGEGSEGEGETVGATGPTSGGGSAAGAAGTAAPAAPGKSGESGESKASAPATALSVGAKGLRRGSRHLGRRACHRAKARASKRAKAARVRCSQKVKGRRAAAH